AIMRREAGVHELADARVAGRIRRDDRVPAALLRRLREARTFERAESLPAAAHFLHLGMTEDGPERHAVGSASRGGDGVVPHGVLVAQRREELVGEAVAVEVVRDEVDVEFGHGALRQSGAFAQPVPAAFRYQPPAALVPPSTQTT